MKPLTIALVAAAAVLAACSKSEPPAPSKSTVPAAPAPVTAAPAPAPVTVPDGETREKLLERLARQEAAAKLFDAPKPEPAPKPAPVKAEPAPAKAAPAPAKSASPPPKAEPPAAVAKAAPAPAPVTQVVRRVEPAFPPEAAREGYDRGLVKARMTVAADGSVTKVEILESNPRRAFDRAVTRALADWKFNAGAAGRTVDTEIAFRR